MYILYNIYYVKKNIVPADVYSAEKPNIRHYLDDLTHPYILYTRHDVFPRFIVVPESRRIGPQQMWLVLIVPRQYDGRPELKVYVQYTHTPVNAVVMVVDGRSEVKEYSNIVFWPPQTSRIHKLL